MTARRTMRDGEIEALIVDRYLESLLARTPQDHADVPSELRDTASRLARDLPRYHPSFRFEEALAARLAAAAMAHEGELIDFPRPVPATHGAGDDERAAVRPVLVGGVLTSAAISLAGAAYFAWRRSRQPGDPMARAARAVARARAV